MPICVQRRDPEFGVLKRVRPQLNGQESDSEWNVTHMVSAFPQLWSYRRTPEILTCRSTPLTHDQTRRCVATYTWQVILAAISTPRAVPFVRSPKPTPA